MTVVTVEVSCDCGGRGTGRLHRRGILLQLELSSEDLVLLIDFFQYDLVLEMEVPTAQKSISK